MRRHREDLTAAKDAAKRTADAQAAEAERQHSEAVQILERKLRDLVADHARDGTAANQRLAGVTLGGHLYLTNNFAPVTTLDLQGILG